jgi:hypothetical protein
MTLPRFGGFAQDVVDDWDRVGELFPDPVPVVRTYERLVRSTSIARRW